MRYAIGTLAMLAGCVPLRETPVRWADPPRVEPVSASLAPLMQLTDGMTLAPVDLPTVLELAGERPNVVRLARERLEIAAAQTDRAFASSLPTIALVGGYFRHTGIIQEVQGPFIEVTKQQVALAASAYLELDLAEGILGWRAARDRERASAEDVAAARQDATLSAALGYYDLVGAQATVAIAHDALSAAEGFLDLTRAREANALGLYVDVLRAQAQVAGARQALIAAEEGVRTASARLATLLRLDPTVTLVSAEPELRALTLVDPRAPVAALISQAVEDRPDLRARSAWLEGAAADADAARYAPFLPSLVVSTGASPLGGQGGGLGWQGPNFGNLEDRADVIVALVWSFPGLGLGDWARAREAEGRLRAARIAEDDLRERIVGEVVISHAEVQSRWAAIVVAQDEVRAAAEALAITVRRFEEGTGLAVDVLVAHEARTRAQSHLAATIVAYDQAQYRLLRSLGRQPGRP